MKEKTRNTAFLKLKTSAGIAPLAVIIIAALAVILGGAGGYFLYNKTNISVPAPQSTAPTDKQNEITKEKPITENTPAPSSTTSSLPEESVVATLSKDIIPQSPALSTVISEDQIIWNPPQEISNLDLFSKNVEEGYASYDYYKVGSIINGEYKGGDFILIKETPYGPNFGDYFSRGIKTGEKFVFLKKYSDYFPENTENNTSELTVNSLEFPQILNGPKSRQTLEIDKSMNYLFDEFGQKGLRTAFHDEKYGDVYTDSDSNIDERGWNIYNGFFIKSPDGTVVTYKLKVDFIGEDRVPDIVWNNGLKNTDQYEFTQMSGCGSRDFAYVVATNSLNIEKDLLPSGVTKMGDVIYELKDPNHTMLKEIYSYVPFGEETISYDEFVRTRPFFFWVDSFGRLIKFESNKFIPPAECGKPVIYLYPEKTEKISVKIKPKGGMTFSEPEYRDGWNVIADPSGNLTETKSGANYPYLFWEGRGSIYLQPKKGFVVAQDSIHAFLIEKLSQAGLNQKEIGDFLYFWEPKMREAPYYFVTFLGTRVMNEIAPLDISPEPDTVIRVLMDFSPLQETIDVEEYEIKTPERKGFTVIEWGGVLR